MRTPLILALLIICSCGKEDALDDSATQSTTDTNSTEEFIEELHLSVEDGSLMLLDQGWGLSSLPVIGEMDAGGSYEIFVDAEDSDRICTEVVFADGERAGPCVNGSSGSLMEGVGDYRVTLTVY